MAAQSNDLGKVLGWVTFGACVLAFFDPRFRKLCFSLLCKL